MLTNPNNIVFSSDADADVLADYVLALLRHDGDVNTVRQLCEAEIPDFLKEDSSIFVQDVFEAIHYKSYLPGAMPPRRPSLPFAPPTGPSAPSYNGSGMGPPLGPQNGSRKRSYNDRGDGDVQDRGYYPTNGDLNGRAFKQSRRGNGSTRGNFDGFNGGGRGGFQPRPPPMNLQGMPSQAFTHMPGIPSPPPGMPPLDPNNPMATILAMQALALPFPGMAGFSASGSPSPGIPATATGPRKLRCRDYDLKGFCARGNTCMYEHGQDSIYVPPVTKGEEYDPTNSSLMTGVEPTNDFTSGNERGGMLGRGRGQHRGGFQNPARGRGGRAEFSSDRPNFDKSNTTIVVENIPEEKFTEDDVREFFSEFGIIEEISMRPYKRLAIVKFNDWNAAKAAYSSPKVIFDNRFVKVYWYTNPESLPKPPAVGAANGGPKNGTPITPAPTPARSTSEPQIDIEEFAKKQQEVQKSFEEKQKKKQEMEVARKELEKRQEELLKSQAEETKKIMERLAAKSGKSVTSPVEVSTNATAGEAKPISQTDVLKAQLAKLEAEAQSLGLDPSALDDSSSFYGGRGRGRGRGRGEWAPRGRGGFVSRGSRGRGRGGAPYAGGGVYKLDNRTKKVSLTGADFTNPDSD